MWKRVGNPIIGENTNENSGFAVQIISDGTKVAIGAPEYNQGQGQVRVFQYQPVSNQWTQLGSSITGLSQNEKFGTSLSLSSDGTKVAIGSPEYSQMFDQQGQVNLFTFIFRLRRTYRFRGFTYSGYAENKIIQNAIDEVYTSIPHSTNPYFTFSRNIKDVSVQTPNEALNQSGNNQYVLSGWGGGVLRLDTSDQQLYISSETKEELGTPIRFVYNQKWNAWFLLFTSPQEGNTFLLVADEENETTDTKKKSVVCIPYNETEETLLTLNVQQNSSLYRALFFIGRSVLDSSETRTIECRNLYHGILSSWLIFHFNADYNPPINKDMLYIYKNRSVPLSIQKRALVGGWYLT